MPIWLASRTRPLPFSVSRSPMLPTIVTSSPSRIQTVPRPITTIQWKRDQGSRSRRAGMRVSILPSCCCSPSTILEIPGASERQTGPRARPTGACSRLASGGSRTLKDEQGPAPSRRKSRGGAGGKAPISSIARAASWDLWSLRLLGGWSRAGSVSVLGRGAAEPATQSRAAAAEQTGGECAQSPPSAGEVKAEGVIERP